MGEIIEEFYTEEHLQDQETKLVIERMQKYRGDFIKSVDVLRKNPGRFIIAIVNGATESGPIETTVASGKQLATGYREGAVDDDQPEEEMFQFGIIRVDNFSQKSVNEAVEKFEAHVKGISGSIGESVGLLDLTQPDVNMVRMGEINLTDMKKTTTDFDMRRV